MKRTTLITLGLVSGLVCSGTVLAHEHGGDKHQDIGKLLNDYGFSHVVEVEWDSDGSIEAEGFSDEQTLAEVSWDKDGKVSDEEKERGRSRAWGLNQDQLKAVMERGKEEGITRFDEIDINQRGRVEVQGYDDNDEEIEFSFSADEL